VVALERRFRWRAFGRSEKDLLLLDVTPLTRAIETWVAGDPDDSRSTRTDSTRKTETFLETCCG